MEEILNLTYQEMKKSDLLNLMATGAVITGGGAILKGTIELAEKMWGIPVKLGIPKYLGGLTESVRNPMYSTAVGLTLYGNQYSDFVPPFSRGPANNLWDEVRENITKFFRRFF
jgi:cell division protein FtsA